MAPAHTWVCLQIMGAETIVTTIVEMIIKVIMRIEEVLVVEMIVGIIMMTMDMAVSYNRGRSNYHNNAGGDDNQMETQRDTIFIQNFAPTVTRDGLKEFFSQIGIIKVRYHYLNSFDIFNENLCYSFDRKTDAPNILISKDKATGEDKGEARITYEDEEYQLVQWEASFELFYLR
jgi:RNA recognition motif-containing protein